MPNEVVFIFKAMHIIGLHNLRSGGSTRTRLMSFTNYCITSLSINRLFLYQWYLKTIFYLKLKLFESSFWLYKLFFGFQEVEFDS